MARDLPAALSAFADGELCAGYALEIEVHLRGCPACAERVSFLKALRASLRRAAAPRCPGALRARLASTLTRGRVGQAPRLIRARYVAAAAAAAGVVFTLAAASSPRRDRPAQAVNPDALSATVVESLLDDLVAQHAQPLPPETTDPDDLPRFDPFVGVPVRRSAFLPFHVDFKGARVHAMRERRAAMLQYTVAGGHRITVYLFDSRRIPVQDAPGLKQRRVR